MHQLTGGYGNGRGNGSGHGYGGEEKAAFSGAQLWVRLVASELTRRM